MLKFLGLGNFEDDTGATPPEEDTVDGEDLVCLPFLLGRLDETTPGAEGDFFLAVLDFEAIGSCLPLCCGLADGACFALSVAYLSRK